MLLDQSLSPRVVILGAGFGGLAAAAYLSKVGYRVTVFEKNNWVGGQAHVFKEAGFRFDMCLDWYRMPEVYERFFADFGVSSSDFYQLKRLNPAHKVFFDDETIEISTSLHQLYALFDHFQSGGAAALKRLLKRNVHDDTSRFSQIRSALQFLKRSTQQCTLDSYVRSHFSAEKLIKLLEFPRFFLAADDTSGFETYSEINQISAQPSSYYPHGGLNAVAAACLSVAEKQGAQILLSKNIAKILVKNGVAVGIKTKNGRTIPADIVISNVDPHFTDNSLLEPKWRMMSESAWNQKKLAPSALMLFLGLNSKISGLRHHSLFLHHNWQQYLDDLFSEPKWPDKPCYVVTCATKSEPSLAPKGGETITIVVPIAAGLADTPEARAKLESWVISDLEQKLRTPIQPHIIIRRSYSLRDFKEEHRAYKGTAFGQRSPLRSTKVRNLFFADQSMTPGVGAPMSILSGKKVAIEIVKQYGDFRKKN